MKRSVVLIIIVYLFFLTGCSADPETAVARRIARVEQGLLTGYDDPPWQKMLLAERMAVHHVPGVSIAVINEYEVEWVKGYGRLQAGGEEPVTPNTLFQTGSIAKPLIAAAALHQVERGLLELDQDVNQSLVSWQVPPNEYTAVDKVTLRRLLSHSAGVTVHGFVGYAQGEELPTLPQILDGEPPANSPPIRVDTVPGTQLRYSGGGYMIVQQLLEDVTGRPFAPLLQETVLEPLDMNSSIFAVSLPAARWSEAASGHYADGRVMLGRWHNYPEQGAGASLWSTPADMAYFAIDLMRAYNGQPAKILSQDMARQMLTPQIGPQGLGLWLGDDVGDRFYFMHDGTNDGYKSVLVAYPQRGQGVVIMTNNDIGDLLWREILVSVSNEYGMVPNYTYAFTGIVLALFLLIAAILIAQRLRERRKAS